MINFLKEYKIFKDFFLSETSLSTYYLFATLLIFPILTSCSSQNNDKHSLIENEQLELTITDSTWTYFSFKTGKVVGKSKINHQKEDSDWKNRNDWDIAFCGDYIRTNSGTSGNGNGGIISIEDYFDNVNTFPAQTFTIDKYLDFNSN